MASKIHITLEVDDKGSAKIKGFGGNADAAFKKIKAGAIAGSTQAGKMEKAWSGAITKMKTHWKAYSAVVAVALTAVAAVVAAGIKKAIGTFAGFEKEMANVSTLGNYTTDVMEGLKKGIMKLPASLGRATELTKGLYQALSAGVKPAESIAFVGKAAMAAKAGLSDTFTAVDAGTTILNAFGMQASEAGHVYDLMFTTVKEGKTTFGELAAAEAKISPIAAAANVSIYEQHAALATLTKGGFKTTEAAARLATSLGAIIKPSSEATKLSKELGLEFNAQALKAKGLHGFLEDVKKATGGNVEQMAQLFGGMESLSVMLALTGKQSQEFTDILGRMGDVSGAAEEAFNKQKKTLSALWDTLKNVVDKIFIMIGSAFAPYLAKIIVGMQSWAEANKEVIAQNLPGYIEKIGDAIIFGIKTMQFFSNAWHGIKLVGTVAIQAIAVALDELFGALRFVLMPLDLIFEGLKKIGMVEVNPFDKVEESLGQFRASSADVTKDVLADIAKTNESYDSTIATLEGWSKKLKETAVAQTKASKSIVKDVGGQVKTEQKLIKELTKDEIKQRAEQVKGAAKAAKDKITASADYAKESTRIYETLRKEIDSGDTATYRSKSAILQKQYTEYKKHLVSLGRENETYADGVHLLDTWLAGEKQKLWESEVRLHGSVADRMTLRWREYQREGIDASRVMYDVISAGAANLEGQMSDNFFNVLTGRMDQVSLDWNSMWDAMARSAADYMARIATETALNTGAKAVSAGMDWLGTAMGWWEVGTWNIKKEQLAALHPGEMVIPADTADKIRAMSSGSTPSVGSQASLGEAFDASSLSGMADSFLGGMFGNMQAKAIGATAMAVTGKMGWGQALGAILGGIPGAAAAGLVQSLASIAVDAMGKLTGTRENEDVRGYLEGRLGGGIKGFALGRQALDAYMAMVLSEPGNIPYDSINSYIDSLSSAWKNAEAISWDIMDQGLSIFDYDVAGNLLDKGLTPQFDSWGDMFDAFTGGKSEGGGGMTGYGGFGGLGIGNPGSYGGSNDGTWHKGGRLRLRDDEGFFIGQKGEEVVNAQNIARLEKILLSAGTGSQGGGGNSPIHVHLDLDGREIGLVVINDDTVVNKLTRRVRTELRNLEALRH